MFSPALSSLWVASCVCLYTGKSTVSSGKCSVRKTISFFCAQGLLCLSPTISSFTPRACFHYALPVASLFPKSNRLSLVASLLLTERRCSVRTSHVYQPPPNLSPSRVLWTTWNLITHNQYLTPPPYRCVYVELTDSLPFDGDVPILASS